MQQPTKDQLKDQLALAAAALILERFDHHLAIRAMEVRLMAKPRPWWRRWFR